MPAISQAATEQQKVAAIENGLSWLYSSQQAGGYWNYGGYEQAATAAAVGAFVSQQNLWGANAPAYQAAVNNGMNYLLSTASVAPVTTRLDGLSACPGGAASCTGVYWYGAGEATYTTGIVASAIGQYAASNPTAVATNTGPLAGMTYRDIAQGITNEFTAGQTTL
ncbi:MAG: hypothetical protein JSR98_04500, partial [Proteobacteria bacterium]|nr:hypothetical protein [Pseudomonadota bacterium]